MKFSFYFVWEIIIEWLHHLDTKEMLEKKARFSLNKIATYRFENILEAVPNKTKTVEPLVSHLTDNPIKMNKTWWSQIEK